MPRQAGNYTSNIFGELNNQKRLLDILEEQKSIHEKKQRELMRLQEESRRWKRDEYGNIVYRDPEKFYHSFGYFTHHFTKEKVETLTPYQIKVWLSVLNNRYNLVLKSNRIGISSIVSLAMFQDCLLYTGAGMDKLIIAQKFDIAKDHLFNLRSWIADSRLFSRFLIQKPDKTHQFQDEASKSTAIYIKNPYNPTGRVSRIIATGSSPGSALSRAYVNWVWISDITISQNDYEKLMDAASTRLLMSRGKMIIETMPSGPKGPIYDLWMKTIRGQTNFKYHKIKIYDAIKYGLVSKEDIDDERRKLGHRFPLFFEAEFISTEGNIFQPQFVTRAEDNGERLIPLDAFQQKLVPKSMGVDPGLGPSRFAITITQFRPVDKMIEVIYSQEYDTQDIDAMARKIKQLYIFYGIKDIWIDASNTGNAGLVYKLKHDLKDKVLDKKAKKYTELHELKFNGEIVNPVHFNKHALNMIHHAQRILAGGNMAIHPVKFQDLLAQIKSATIINEATSPKLDKDTNGSMDGFDSWLLTLIGYSFQDVTRSGRI